MHPLFRQPLLWPLKIATIGFWGLLLAISPLMAQSYPFEGPVSLTQNASGQYARLALPSGIGVAWSITGGTIVGSNTNDLVVFNAGGVGNLVLRANLSNGRTQEHLIPIRAGGPALTEGTVINFGPGIRQYPIYQLLRGERIVVTTTAESGAPPLLRLLDFQGRQIVVGDTIDYITTVRGSYFLVLEANANGRLQAKGIRPAAAGEPSSMVSTPLTLPTAAVGQLGQRLWDGSTLSAGEALVHAGDTLIAATYEVEPRQTVLRAFWRDQLIWTWTSNRNDYLRSLTLGNRGEILGIGRSGGAGATAENILVVRLSNHGKLLQRVEFGSPGYDYGYGIAALPDQSLLAAGFTTGAFPGFGNRGGFDGFVAKITALGTLERVTQFGSPQNDRVFGAKAAPNGTVILFGDTEGTLGSQPALGEFDLFLVAYNDRLEAEWLEQFGSPENDLAFDLIVEPSQSAIFLTGMTTGAIPPTVGNPLSPQVYLLRFDLATRKPLWVRQLGPNEGQSGETLARSATGVAVLFYTNGSFPGVPNNSLGTRASDDMVIGHYAFDGTLTWLLQFNQTTERIFARGLAFTSSGGYVLRDQVYVPGAPFSTATLDAFILPNTSVGLKTAPPVSSLMVYPNPVKAFLQITGLGPDDRLQVINSLGEILFSGLSPAFIDFSGWPSGWYTLLVQDSTGGIRQSTRIVKP